LDNVHDNNIKKIFLYYFNLFQIFLSHIHLAKFESVGLTVVVECVLVSRDTRVVAEAEVGQVSKPLECLNISCDTRAYEVEYGQVLKPLEDLNVPRDARVLEVECGQVLKPLEDLNVPVDTCTAEVECGQVLKSLQDSNVPVDTRYGEFDCGQVREQMEDINVEFDTYSLVVGEQGIPVFAPHIQFRHVPVDLLDASSRH
jgi:hypothetical protein